MSRVWFLLLLAPWVLCCSLLARAPNTTSPSHPPRIVSSGELTFWTESMGEFRGNNAIVLIAGLGGSARFWPDCFCQTLVDAGYFVIRYDHRHVGLSSLCPQSFSIEDLGDDIATILDAYDIQQTHLIGISMGGMIAQFVAANHPERVLSVSLVSTAPIGATKDLDMPMTFSETLIVSNTLQFVATHRPQGSWEESFPVALQRYEYFNGEYPIDVEITRAYFWDLYHHSHRDKEEIRNVHFQNIQDLMATLNKRRHIFEKIEAPTLIIHGALDNLILLSRGGLALHHAIQDSEFKVYPKMGHGLFNRTLLHALATDILSFIERHATD